MRLRPLQLNIISEMSEISLVLPHEREKFLISEITEGLAHVKAGKMIIVSALTEVCESELWRVGGYKSLEEWATYHFNFSSREVYNYLYLGQVVSEIKRQDESFDTSGLALRHAITLKQVVEPDHYITVLNSVRNNGKITAKSIASQAIALESEGLISRKDRVKKLESCTQERIKFEIRKLYLNLNPDNRADILNYLKELDK